jgi:hypothetical protein
MTAGTERSRDTDPLCGDSIRIAILPPMRGIDRNGGRLAGHQQINKF